MKLYSKVMAALLAASLAAQLMVPAYAYNVSSDTSTGGQVVINNQDGTQQILTQEDLENGADLPEGIVIENGENTQAPATPAPEVSQAPAQESEAPAQESEAPAQQTPAPTQSGGDTNGDRIDMNLPVVSPSTGNGSDGSATQQETPLAVYWNPGSGYELDQSKLSVAFQGQQSQKGIIQQGLSWLSNLVSGVFGGGSKTVQVPAGKDSNSGRSPMAPVKTFEAAMEQAQALADEQGVDVRDVTIYSMNPQEVLDGETLEVSGADLTVQAWEGRTYDSDVLFYVNNGTLTMEGVNLLARDEENEEESAQTLVQVFDGSVVMGASVAVNGGFTLDFRSAESEKLWDEDSALTDEKVGSPVIELTEDFQPDSSGYSITVLGQSEENERQEVVRTSGMTDAQVQSYAGSFALMGEDSQGLSLEVDQQDQNQSATTVDSGAAPASLSLYAVRDANSIIYWNPGGDLLIEGTTYPAGVDENRDGLKPSAALKTFAKALEAAKTNNTSNIVCMQTINLNDGTVNGDRYLEYDEATKTFKLHGVLVLDQTIRLTNWIQNLPIVDIRGDYTLSLENVELTGHGTTGSERGSNLVTVGHGATVTMGTKATVTTGSYIQVEFAEGVPNPIQVSSQDAKATIFASGITYASHYEGTKLVQATDALVSQLGDKDAAGKHLLGKFGLSTQNTSPSPSGQDRPVKWSLVQNTQDSEQDSLVLKAAKTYETIYIDPIRGSDDYDGLTCLYPVQTIERALAVLDQGIAEVLLLREANQGTMTAEQLEEEYPLPGHLAACSTIEITDTQNWDWSEYQKTDPVTNTVVKPYLTAHEEGSQGAEGQPTHKASQYVIRVNGSSASLTLKDVRIFRTLDRYTWEFDKEQWNLINVVNGGQLTLDGATELFTQDVNSADGTPAYLGVGIVAGKEAPAKFEPFNPQNSEGAATVTLTETWTGKIYGLRRGVALTGKATSMTMSGGTITGNQNSGAGAGVGVFQGANFTMKGGAISGNKAAIGAGVLVSSKYGYMVTDTSSKFTMVAGTIQGNTIDLGVDGLQGYEGMGGAGILGYYAVVELGQGQEQKGACRIEGNSLSRDSGWGYSWAMAAGVGVSIYGQNTWDDKALIVNGATITENKVDDGAENFYQRSLNIGGIGLGLSEVKCVQVENADITNNSVVAYYQGTTSRTLQGGGLYVSGSSDATNLTFRNLTVTGNQINASGISAANSGRVSVKGGGIYFAKTDNNPVILLENSTVSNNELAQSGKLTSVNISGQGGGIYSGIYLRINKVTISNNKVGDEINIGRASGGGVYGSILWANQMTLDRNSARSSGGGWYNTMKKPDDSDFDVVKTVIQDCVITNNRTLVDGVNDGDGGGGGITFWGWGYEYSCTFTETEPGTSKITGNHAAGTGGGVYMYYAGITIFDFTSPWENTADHGAGNLLSDTVTTSGGETYLLQGTFVGTDSIQVWGREGQKDLYVDLKAVTFQADPEGGTVVTLTDPSAVVSLLTSGDTSHPLGIKIDPNKFGAGSVVVRPANLDKVTMPVLSESADQPGGYTLGSMDRAYTALKDASTNGSGTPTTDYITVTGLPLRTQLTAVPEGQLTSLGLVAEGVYLDGVNGKDGKDGLSAQTAVRTWGEAVKLLEKYSTNPPTEEQKTNGFQPIIWVCNTVSLSNGETLSLPQSVVSQTYKDFEENAKRTPERAAFKRFGSFQDAPMFKVNGGTVTITNARIDGNSEAMASPTYDCLNVKVVGGGTLNVENGARIYNGYAACVELEDRSTLNVTQNLTPEEVNADTDEGYGIQIDAKPKKGKSSWSAVNIKANCEVNLNKYAYLGSQDDTTPVQYALSFLGAATIHMNDQSLVRAANCVKYSTQANLVMNDFSTLEAVHDVIAVNGSTDASLTMNDNSRIAVRSDSSTAKLSLSSSGSFTMTMLDQSRVECAIISDVNDNAATNDGVSQLIMGKQGGADTPSIAVPNNSNRQYPGTIQVGGGHMYLEMNAGSSVKGSIYVWGMTPASETAQKPGPNYGIMMRDQAKLEAADNNPAAVVLCTGERSYGGDHDNFNKWDGTQQFSIVLDGTAQMLGGIHGKFSSDTELADQIMGDDQHITLRGNAKVTGTIGDKDYGTSISKVVLEGNATIQASDGMTPQDYVVKARQVILKGTSTISASTTDADTTVFGQGVSVYALKGMSLDGTANVGGPIQLAQNVSITLTSPVPGTAQEGCFKLHLAAYHMGEVVVQSGGDPVTDASTYLSYFVKYAAQGEASQVNLVGDGKGNIILNRLWNVYLSTNGDDANNGASPQTAVRTFQRAKELLTTVEGYGPTDENGNGSNIIIPDSVNIAVGDYDWSFEEGGTLTNVKGETWTPVITRSPTTVYTKPLIIIDGNSYNWGGENPVKFSNITLDAGGNQATFALEETEDFTKYQNTLLYFNGDGNGSKFNRVLELGEGTVIQNLDYDMAKNGTGLNELTLGEYAGGYAVNVRNGGLVIDGAVIQDFHVKNFNYDGGLNGTTAGNSATIVHVTGEYSSLVFNSGSIRNNSVDVAKFRTDSDCGGVGIVSVSGGAAFTMTGGEIANNTVSGNADQIETAQNGYAVPVGILVLDTTYYETSAKMSGGSIRDNVNLMKATNESGVNREDRYAEGIISVGSRRLARNYTDPYMEFTIAGGSITGNQARRGSAITLAHGTVVLAGGTIQDNRSVVEVGAEGWQAEYSPIFIGDRVPDDSLNRGFQRLVLQGDGCKFDSPIYLPVGRQIMVSGQLRDTNRVYEIYQGDSNLVQGSAVVIPDTNYISDVTPYLQNFRVYAKGMVLDRGRVKQDITVQQGTRNEQDCLVLMKAVFVDGSGGKDPAIINIYNPQYDRGLRPDEPVKTLDAARAIGQAFCEMDEFVYEDTADHQKHKDHYVIYAVGPVYEKLYEGTVLNGNLVGYTKNDSLQNFQFTLGGASYLTRYTGWEMYVGNGQSVSGKYYYGNLIEVNGAATFQNITVQGRREIDSVDKNGETLVVVNSGAKLTMGAGTKLELNNATGSRPRPDDPGLTQSIDSRGGAIRVAADANLVMTGGIIDSSCTALDGGSIYLEGGADSKQTAQLTISNQVNIGGEIYLGGAQGKDIPISVDRTFAPVSPIRIGMESDYDGKPVVRWTDGTPVNEAMLEQFSYSSSVSALYETEAVSSSGDGSTLDTIALDLRRIVYLDPVDGRDTNDGAKPEQAVQTLDRIYTMYENVPEEDVPGVLVFVMNPIKVAKDEQLVISNGQLKETGVTKHISVYSKNTRSDTFDTSVGIVHSTTEKVIPCELYFRRYARTSDQGPPAGYNKDSNLKELFVVEGGGQLQLNGVYLDGQSLGIQTSGQPGLSSDGVVAQAPLVQVQAGGSAQFLSGALGSYQGSTADYQAVTSQLSNNTNNNAKTTPLPGTDGIAEGSSAGIEILSSGTGNGWASETRGKVVLQNSKFENLKLATDNTGKAVIGGSDIYQNGELSISNNIRFGGTVFLEGNGRSGEEPEAKLSRQTSRWISVSAYGSPVESAFQVVVRDAYHNRRMVVYPYSESDKIQQSEIAMYMLTQEASRHYILVNEQLSKEQGENDFLGKGENTLWLRVPPVVYIDPVSGNDETGDGRYPDTAVKTLPRAIDVMKGLSAKVLYVLSPIPITGNSYLYPTGYTYDGTSVALPSQNLQLDIRRYVQPDAPTTVEHYKTASYTSGALFDIQAGGSLTLEGNVILDGASQGQTGPEVPADQTYINGVQVTAPLVTVQQGGTLELRSDGQGQEVTRPTLTNNDNTGTVGATSAQRVAGGAINNEGTVILNGGMLVNNKAESVTGTDGMKGMANGIYQAGELTIRSYPQGLTDQSVYLAANHVISVDMQIQEMGDAAGEISLDMDNAVAGRDVVTYTNATNVDAESARYSLGNSVPGSLFLVQAESAPNVLELQDWKQLNVTVPEEVFLVVYDTGANGAQVGKGDVDSYGYGVPEYTITNGGTRNVRVSVNGFDVAAVRGENQTITLVDSAAGLTGEGALLYLALTKSSETAEAGNSFADLVETSLKMSDGKNIELGTLGQGKHGSFAFTGSANQAFLNQWMDSAFPANPPEGGSLAEARKDYMRTKDSATGETSLANAAAQFKLTYRIELA